MTEKYQTEFEAAVATANKAGRAAQDKKKQAEETLASLGAFKFSEKKAQRALIVEAEVEMAAAEQAAEAAKAAKTDALAGLTEALDSYVATQIAAVEELFPMPTEPIKPAVILEDERKAEEKRVKEACKDLLGSYEKNQKNEKKRLVELLCDIKENEWYRGRSSDRSITVSSFNWYKKEYFKKLYDLHLVEYKSNLDKEYGYSYDNYKLTEKGIRLKQEILSLGTRRDRVLGLK